MSERQRNSLHHYALINEKNKKKHFIQVMAITL